MSLIFVNRFIVIKELFSEEVQLRHKRKNQEEGGCARMGLKCKAFLRGYMTLLCGWYVSSDFLVYRSITDGPEMLPTSLLHVYSHIISVLLTLFAWSVP